MMETKNIEQKWEFYIDRGGTFTDIVALNPQGEIIIHKLLSENPEHYQDSAIEGIRVVMGVAKGESLPTDQIAVIKMGTTVATNALLERKGEPVVLVINQGFRDALRIGYQHRPDIFARNIILPEMLYQEVVEVSARYSAQGEELTPVDTFQVEQDLLAVYRRGIRSCAIVLLHGYRYSQHEQQIQAIAGKIGFSQISVSHQVSPLMKLISRGDTTVVDAYLSPILQRYVNQVRQIYSLPHSFASDTQDNTSSHPQLMFMQSNGGLANADYFQGKDSILSGPAGGVVGAVKICQKASLSKIITFDMGGTSTDVAHFLGEYERNFDTEVAGVRLRAPMMAIHTVAAGGGSICYFDGHRYRVGPESAGANPGPACYGKGGSLTITDCNLLLGKIQTEFFPRVFGKNADSPLDLEIVKHKFAQLKAEINSNYSLEEIAQGFLAIAVEKMANAIKKISLQKGYDVSEYCLCCFGSAGGQHACLIAESLGIKQIIIDPLAGVLSAYGIGLADLRIIKEKSINLECNLENIKQLNYDYSLLKEKTIKSLRLQLEQEKAATLSEQDLKTSYKLYLKYEGTDSNLTINFTDYQDIFAQFNDQHQKQYGFILPDKKLLIEQISLELIYPTLAGKKATIPTRKNSNLTPQTFVKLYSKHQWHDAPVYLRDQLASKQKITGPALIIESTGCNVIELGWQAAINQFNQLILTPIKIEPKSLLKAEEITKPTPILLEIFNNLFRFIAEQMGVVLQNTSYSVNIKERLDFSCAIFDAQGELVANAPHIPVHLGSMSESVKALINDGTITLNQGDVYITNNPYNGGTHLPDITVITPIFSDFKQPASFYVASRGHHADIGGITPGSMPPDSKTIEEEGILINNFCLVKQGKLQEQELFNLLTNHQYPVRNYQQNLVDLQAQIAANEKGKQELQKLVKTYGLNTVKKYMQFIQDNGEQCVKKVLKSLPDGEGIIELDNGAKIQLKITINQQDSTATIDFTGTSPQLNNNFNAPVAVCQAVVIYVFRTLVDDDIPLNAGCLKPLNIIIPVGCLLNPQYPAPVVAGNVETSQNITDCLYSALGIMANSQGTMNNFTFGNAKYQYYETICGGSGAGIDHHGTDAVHTHMTNSRLTDPEVLEWRFPVRLEKFAIRDGSGGEGKFKGGNGVIRVIRFLEPMSVGILSSRRRVCPQGLKGGQPGKKGHNYLIKSNQEKIELSGNAKVEMNVDDLFVIETPGGGGFFSNPETSKAQRAIGQDFS
jgi:5-oxoprolinase (ATP-hydrolysing)